MNYNNDRMNIWKKKDNKISIQNRYLTEQRNGVTMKIQEIEAHKNT